MSRLGRIPALESPPRAAAGVTDWSAPLGEWAGVPVRIHVSLAAVLVVALGACWHGGGATPWLALAVYVVSLLTHEAAHLAAVAQSTRSARRLRSMGPIVLGPLGGLQTLAGGHDPRELVFCAMSGPLANLLLVVAGMCALAGGAPELVGQMMIDPEAALAASATVGATPLATLAPLLIAINWPLFLVNMAPASPMDGGVALRCWLGVWMGPRAARDATCFVALLLAAVLIGAGGTLVLVQNGSAVVGVALAVLAVLVGFGARADAVAADPNRNVWPDMNDDLVGVSLTELPTASLRRDPGELATARRSVVEQADTLDERGPLSEEGREDDRWDEGRVDAILAKVHRSGMAELTANERAILQRASRLYQRRRRPHD